jgi:hypothetical protein
MMWGCMNDMSGEHNKKQVSWTQWRCQIPGEQNRRHVMAEHDDCDRNESIKTSAPVLRPWD